MSPACSRGPVPPWWNTSFYSFHWHFKKSSLSPAVSTKCLLLLFFGSCLEYCLNIIQSFKRFCLAHFCQPYFLATSSYFPLKPNLNLVFIILWTGFDVIPNFRHPGLIFEEKGLHKWSLELCKSDETRKPQLCDRGVWKPIYQPHRSPTYMLNKLQAQFTSGWIHVTPFGILFTSNITRAWSALQDVRMLATLISW